MIAAIDRTAVTGSSYWLCGDFGTSGVIDGNR